MLADKKIFSPVHSEDNLL